MKGSFAELKLRAPAYRAPVVLAPGFVASACEFQKP
jgi:hypothetical protein